MKSSYGMIGHSPLKNTKTVKHYLTTTTVKPSLGVSPRKDLISGVLSLTALKKVETVSVRSSTSYIDTLRLTYEYLKRGTLTFPPPPDIAQPDALLHK